MLCDYCGKEAILTTGQVIYPNRPDLKYLRFWQCPPCGAYVGVHKNSKDFKPLGRLANAELRRWKMAVHEVFDPMWKGRLMTRERAYLKLSQMLGIKKELCHIGMFDVETCQRAVGVLKDKKSAEVVA